jgi:hypothetical protein
MMQKRDSLPLILTAGFVLMVLALNFQIFTQPIVEAGDYAANSLLVQQARHFTLLTGHYSRWQFQHPGPAFLYLFALGEVLFYDLLHVVPAPYNGQILITVIFNGALLCAALYVFRRHAKLSVPLALLATEVVTVLVNTSGQPSMLISNWMPDVLLFPFLLFAVSAASVLAGETRDLPFLAVSGMLLIHSHFAQFLFVGVIGGATVAYILVRTQRHGGLRPFLSERRRDFIVAAAIVFAFAVPPLIEIALDRPNNLDALLAYLHQFGGTRNNIGMAIGYFACFLLFIGRPDIALTKGPIGILAIGSSRFGVVAYWMIMALLFVAGLSRYAAMKQRPPFLKYLAWIGAGSVVLFLYWAKRITGGFLVFNGTFIYSLHLAAWFLLLAMIEPGLNRRVARNIGALTLLVIFILGIGERKALRASVGSQPDDVQAALAVPASRFGTLALTFEHNDWPSAVGLAISMQRIGKPFCVNPNWGIMFSRANICPDMRIADRLWLTTGAAPCEPPCRNIYRSTAFSLTRTPAQPVALPLKVDPHDWRGLDRTGFNEGEVSYCWTQKHASIRLWLSPSLPTASCFRIALTGHAAVGRPAQLSLNGWTLGTLSKTAPDTALFVVPREAIRPGEINSISLDTEKAGPSGADIREIGFDFDGLVLRAATPDEPCVADPATQPEYISIRIDWPPTCYPAEGTPPHQWRWCGPDTRMLIHNSSSKPRRLTLSADLSTDHEKPAPLKIRSPFFADAMRVSRRRLTYVRTFTVPPGDHAIVFTCLAPKSGPSDPRNLVLRFEHFRLEPASGPLP